MAAVRVYIAVESSGSELAGAYRDPARSTLKAAAKGFESAHDDSAVDTPALLRRGPRALMTNHRELPSAAVYGRADPVPIVSIGSAGRGAELPMAPIEGERPAIAYDMRPAQSRLDEKGA